MGKASQYYQMLMRKETQIIKEDQTPLNVKSRIPSTTHLQLKRRMSNHPYQINRTPINHRNIYTKHIAKRFQLNCRNLPQIKNNNSKNSHFFTILNISFAIRLSVFGSTKTKKHNKCTHDLYKRFKHSQQGTNIPCRHRVQSQSRAANKLCDIQV